MIFGICLWSWVSLPPREIRPLLVSFNRARVTCPHWLSSLFPFCVVPSRPGCVVTRPFPFSCPFASATNEDDHGSTQNRCGLVESATCSLMFHSLTGGFVSDFARDGSFDGVSLYKFSHPHQWIIWHWNDAFRNVLDVHVPPWMCDHLKFPFSALCSFLRGRASTAALPLRASTLCFLGFEGHASIFPLFLHAWVVCRHAPSTSDDCEVVESPVQFLQHILTCTANIRCLDNVGHEKFDCCVRVGPRSCNSERCPTYGRAGEMFDLW